MSYHRFRRVAPSAGAQDLPSCKHEDLPEAAVWPCQPVALSNWSARCAGPRSPRARTRLAQGRTGTGVLTATADDPVKAALPVGWRI